MMLEIKDLHVKYGAIHAIQGVSLGVDEGEVASRSVYDEQQVGLADNLLNMGTFIKRRGQWVTAEQLAAEGMRKAVKDIGL